MLCLIGFCEVCGNDEGIKSDLFNMSVCEDCWEDKINEIIEVK